jgi:Ribonuclease G/E
MAEINLEELKLGERKFLHDIANSLVVAQGMTTMVLRKVKENSTLEAKEIERLEKVLEAVNKMGKQIKDRRAILIGSEDVIS